MKKPALGDVVVFESLRVHDIKVEPRQVQATYTLTSANRPPVAQQFIYSYAEPVFTPSRAADVNLASVMLAQVAINYGLFCRRLIFDGLFDAADRQFIRDMTENTSREIYVNKLLQPNAFLQPPFDALEPQPQEHYTAAELVFTNTGFPDLELREEVQKPDYTKFAILSSGGKDSLLSYGILSELFEAHPVFVNESGRHWYTAYNAFHYFEEKEPRTAKVWCNSDRLFNWMARQMPFIKPNFQHIRADIYPIRLWTVAVFLFGVLPVARKRGLGNIVIGDEYDTTIQLNHHGITHYAALYDQSKYFDNALTRYYRRKGWNLHQFSILRPLSELLILKILVKRYPELQELQVSCHAAHKEADGRMHPCGKCEKCRRVVGMLLALDEDPRRCGYTDPQIEACLHALENHTVKQLSSDAHQLYFLLLQKGLIRETGHTRRMAREHPEILRLRFDNERSMIEDLPGYIRRPLLDLFVPYAEGIVHMHQRKWEPATLEDLAIDKVPYKATKPYVKSNR